jgi:hypothetical protein
MMEALSTSEASVNFYEITWCSNPPEDSHLEFICTRIGIPVTCNSAHSNNATCSKKGWKFEEFLD